MQVFWRETKRGQQLVLSPGDDENEEEIGGVRATKRGFDAFAKTFGYEPGRAQKDMTSMEEAKEFVESFKPWELYSGSEGLSVEPQPRPRKS